MGGVPRNGYLTYETALASFHAVKADGTLLKGMPVFQEAYAAVGLGWVWAIYNNPLAARFLDFGYSLFARYRTDLTRGSSLETLYAARRVARGQKMLRCARPVHKVAGSRARVLGVTLFFVVWMCTVYACAV